MTKLRRVATTLAIGAAALAVSLAPPGLGRLSVRPAAAQVLARAEGPDGPLPGAWWRSPEAAGTLGLSPEQTAKLEEIFRAERRRLVDLRAEVDKARLDLEDALAREPFDEAAVAQVVDRFEARRAQLAKARTMMLVRMRGVLTKEQYEMLRTRFRERGRQFMRERAHR